jgi:hypothetical protein
MSLATQLATLVEERGVRCPKCHRSDALDIHLMAEGMHYAKVICVACDDAFVTWAPKPTTKPVPKDGRKKRLLETLRAYYDPEPLYCLMCLGDERTFPEGVWLEAHHILEHQDGGTDDPINLQPLCNECHSLVHWRRRTTRTPQVGKEDDDA